MSSNIETVQKIYAAFGRGDVPAILENIADDMVAFSIVADATPEIPWHLPIAKKRDVPKFFQALAAECDFTLFEPHAFAAGGDHVYASISFDVTLKRNGKKVSFRNTMHRFTFSGGRVVEWRGTEDTAKTRDAFAAPARTEANRSEVMMRMRWAGVTRQQYDAMKAKVDWVGKPPTGGVYHIASLEKDGLHVTDVWRSAEDLQRFVQTRLMPAAEELKIPGEPSVVVHPAHAVFDAVRGVEL